MRLRTAIRFVLAGVLAIAAAGCGPAASGDRRSRPPETSSEVEGSGSAGSGGCAFTVEYDGSTYLGTGVGISPLEGSPLGQVTLPACNDTGEAEENESGEEIEIAELQGVSPSVAVTWRGHRDTVLIREDAERNEFPPELKRLLQPPECDPDDVPIELSGPWLGILGADEHTELDLMPPYDLDIHVAESSDTGYERAFLTIRVPEELGRPLSRADVRSSLWKGGTISVTAGCRGGKYVAEQVESHPPSE